jgi:outer membrane protein TolC
VLALGLALSGRAHAQELADIPTITFAEMLRVAQRNPPAVLLAFAQLRQAQADRGFAKAAWAPALTSQGSLGYTYDNRVIIPGVPRVDSQSIEARAALSLDWAALDLARGQRIDAASAAERSRNYDVDAARLQAAALATEFYLRAGAAIEFVNDAQLSLERRSHQYEATTELVKAGTRSPVDAQRAKIEVLSTEYALSLRQTEQLAAFAALASALGRPANELVRPATNTAEFQLAADSPARAKQLASANRPELRSAAANITSLQRVHDADIDARWPTLGASAIGSISYLDVRSGVGIEGDQYTATGAVYVRWQGLDPAVWGRGGVSEAAVGVANQERRALLQSITTQAVAAYYVLERAKTFYQSAVAVLDAAQVTREAQNGRYVAGLGSLLELLDAEDLEQQARQRRIEAERDQAIASAQLLAACGLLMR